MGEDEPGHRSCSERMPIELWSTWSRRLEDSVEQPVVNGFPMVELGNFNDTMKTVCSDL